MLELNIPGVYFLSQSGKITHSLSVTSRNNKMVKRPMSKPNPALILRLDFHRSFQILKLVTRLPDTAIWLMVGSQVESFGDLMAQIIEDFEIDSAGIELYDRGNVFISPDINIRFFMDYVSGEVEPIVVKPYFCNHSENRVGRQLLDVYYSLTSDRISAMAYIIFVIVSLFFLLSCSSNLQ
ncbi:unnamed protein product, partial [Allacma fusca]